MDMFLLDVPDSENNSNATQIATHCIVPIITRVLGCHQITCLTRDDDDEFIQINQHTLSSAAHCPLERSHTRRVPSSLAEAI